jgi:uncharacterized protein (TIGR00730 family)
MLHRLCVFCGSQLGVRPVYADAARELGRAMASRNVELVYGGGHIGLMGVVADAILDAGGRAIGVIPQALVERELAHEGLTELHVTAGMHERKALMAGLSDAFVALPGGFGTADEWFEILTWAQLKLHAKPVGLLDVDGFFDPLLAWIDRTVTEGFVKSSHRDALIVERDVDRLLDRLAAAST